MFTTNKTKKAHTLSSAYKPTYNIDVYKVGHGCPINSKLEFSQENSIRNKNYRK